MGGVAAAAILVGVIVWLATAGAVLQSAAIAVRWIEVGHGPYIGRFESMSANALA